MGVRVYSARMNTLVQSHEYRQEIKKSRFIALAKPVGSAEEAMAFFTENSDSAARHNCWAYKVGTDYRFNDDGEPSGTAGKPILSAIEYADLTNVAVLVIRWFGGIKLGTGGLARAYGGSASACLNDAEHQKIKIYKSFSLRVPFNLTGAIHHLLSSNGVQKISEEYTDRGLFLELSIEAHSFAELEIQLRDMSQGALSCITD